MQTDQSLLTPGVQVWVPHPTEGFRAAEVVEPVPKKGFKVRIDEDEKPVEEVHPHTDIWLRNPAILEGVDDLTKLSYMHEAAILHNLHMRYMTMQVYTYTGPILIAVNPYQRLPIYSKQMISQYCGQPLGKLSPHVYAIAEDAFRAMLTERRSQSILVSGESGAGKTETAKFLLQYFAAMGEENKGEGNVHNQVLESTPLLEAFGNAKTLRNDNSSRFGKFIGIQFDRSGNISGASIQTYLLEKSRIVRQMNGERNYHIFYQLIAGATDDEKAKYHLTSVADYRYVSQSDCMEIEGVADEKVFGHTKKALTIAGIGADLQAEMWKLVSAILHLGNWKKGNDGPLQTACSLMECDFEGIKSSLTQRKVVAVREVYIVDLDDEQSEGARDALAMLLYSRLFDWLVVALNDNLQRNKKPGSSDEAFIGVLDIYGFESFDVNSFEQFCINYANEKLQQQFNQHMFKVEQQEYLKEKLDWSYINFNDNQECLDLIEKKPLGILSLLDEECRFPKSSPKSLALKLKQNHIKSKYFKSDPRQSENSFVIHHYAGSVGYDTTFFLDKNKDFLIEDQVKVLLDSKSSFVRGIFAPKPQPAAAAAAPAKGGRGESSAVKFVSVAAQFRDSLAELMSTIEKTSPHYVRCIKPNPQKKQGIFEKPKVLEQLRCGGVLESVRVCMAGYPGRHSYDQFYKRYRLLVPSAGSGASDAQTATKELVAALKLGEGQFQFGLTKLFLKGGEIAILERKRGEKLSDAAVMMQKTWRRFKAKQHLRRLKDSLIRMQSFVRMVLAKKLLVVLRRQRAATNIQKTVRAWRARTRLAKQKKAIIYVQRVFKAKREKRILRALRREKAATAIQAAIRGKLQRKRYQKAYRQVTIVQGLWRVKKAKALLEKLKRKAQALSKVVAAKAALEKKVDEMELRYAVESKMKKKVEKENARIKAEVEELKKTIKDMKILEEKREKEKEEAAARREKEGQNKARGHERELEELKAKLREESEARAALAAELDQARSTLDRTSARADEAERQRDAAQAEVAQLRERLAVLESGDAEKDRTIAELQRDAEKLRIRAPKKKMDGEKMERLQDRKSDYASMKSLREGHLSTSSTALADLGGRTRSRASSTDEAAAPGGDQAEAERERKLRLGRSPSARDIRPRDRQRAKEKEQDKQRLEREREKKKKEKSSTRGSPASSPSGSPLVARGGGEQEKPAQTSPKVAKLVLPARTDIDTRVDDADSESDDDTVTVDREKKSVAAAEASTPLEAATTTASSSPTPATAAVKTVEVAARPTAPERAESDYLDSRNLSDKDRERREVERGIIDRLKSKYEGKHSLVCLDNEAIMTLLPDSRDVTSRNFIRFLLSELEPGFVSGVPVPAFVIYSFLCFWNLLAPQTSPRKTEGEADDTLGFILEGIYDGAKANFRENEMIIYWLSVASSLCHLVDQRLARGGSADASDSSVTASAGDAAALPDELFVMDSLEDVDNDESSLSFTNKQRAEIRAGSFTAHQFKQHLRELVKRLYTILLKRVYETLEQMLNEIVLGKDWTSSSPFRSGPQQRVAVKNTSSDSITAVLSQYLLGLVQNFIYLSLVQKFFSQVLWFINSILFNEVLLCTQFCSTTKAMDLKVHMGNIDRWIQEEGGLWLENSQGQLSHLDQLITLLMINKKHIVSSDQMRKEVIPKLNILQIKQVLAMYTPTDLEERISLSDIQKLDRAARAGSGGGGDDDALLLESTKLFPLAARELHYLELDDANSIPFPFEIKQKIHDIVEQDILKRMTVATKVQQVREKKGRFSSMLLYTSRGSRKSDGSSTGESTTSSSSPSSSPSSFPSSSSLSPSSASSPTTTPRAAALALGAGSPGSPRGGSGLSFLQRLTEGSGMLPQRRSSSPVTHTPRELRLAQAQAQAQAQQPSSPGTSTAAAAAAADDDGRKAVGLGIRRPMRGRASGGEEDSEEERERRRRDQEEIERLQLEIERKEREEKEAKAKAESEKEKEKEKERAKAKAHNDDLVGRGGDESAKGTVDTTNGGDDDDSTSDSDSDGDEIVFDEEDDRNESARRTKAALDAVVHKQGRTGSFWSSFFK